MEEASLYLQNGQSDTSLSALSDFAQIYCFLQRFGLILGLPSITLKELEDFFISGYCSPSDENQVVYIHWRLLHNVCRSEGRKEWQRMALKLARRNGLIRELVPYDSLSVEKRMKLFRLACEEQFDSNMTFKNELKKQVPVEALHSAPIGLDYDGQRHWLLQDAVYDIRLYGERDYDQAPPRPAIWVELAKSLDELGGYIALLDSHSRRHQQNGNHHRTSTTDRSTKSSPPRSDHVQLSPATHTNEQCISSINTTSSPTSSVAHVPAKAHSSDNEMVASNNNTTLPPPPDPPAPPDPPLASSKDSGSSSNDTTNERSARPRRSSSRTTSKQKGSKRKVTVAEEKPKETVDVEGCMQCHKDVDYEQMLLCDECEKECHTYCQYPRLWSIPEGKWVCPICREESLLSKLKKTYLQLSDARALYERTQERKQRSVARLQKSGLLLQNIIMEDDVDDSSGRRSRRSRKEVNYAELNDVYLPPLGPQDYVGAELGSGRVVPLSVRTRRMDYYIQEDYLAPRVRSSSRRFRGSPLTDEILTSTTIPPTNNGNTNSPLDIPKPKNISDTDSESPTSGENEARAFDYEMESEMKYDYVKKSHEKHVRFEEGMRQLSWSPPNWPSVSESQDKVQLSSSKNVSSPQLICNQNELAPGDNKLDVNQGCETEHMDVEASSSNNTSDWTATETPIPPMV